ncbi:hypothetical protein RvY_16140 [Ramazzottius varieornatus]|uniref:Peptidase A2 domain-containing protein n=1 Tax=Ramazzottius varieornatus TaxID=947166 RepID=A0A1D1W1W9_RAMVA|nr:hypothetical protein RvY_16140 [Ramazzottius varieornatus]
MRGQSNFRGGQYRGNNGNPRGTSNQARCDICGLTGHTTQMHHARSNGGQQSNNSTNNQTITQRFSRGNQQVNSIVVESVKEKGQTKIVPVLVEKQEQLALVDSGAGASVISGDLTAFLGLEISEPLLTVSAVNGQRVLLTGRVQVELTLCGKSQMISLHVMQHFPSQAYGVILGTDVLAQFDVMIDVAKNRVFTSHFSESVYAPHTVIVPARTALQVLVPVGELGCEEVFVSPNKLILESKLLSAANCLSKLKDGFLQVLITNFSLQDQVLPSGTTIGTIEKFDSADVIEDFPGFAMTSESREEKFGNVKLSNVPVSKATAEQLCEGAELSQEQFQLVSQFLERYKD